MVNIIDVNKQEYEIEPICRVLPNNSMDSELCRQSRTNKIRIFGGVLKSMLASDIAIIDIEEYQIKHF